MSNLTLVLRSIFIVGPDPGLCAVELPLPTKRRKVTVVVRAGVLGWLTEATPRGPHRRISTED